MRENRLNKRYEGIENPNEYYKNQSKSDKPKYIPAVCLALAVINIAIFCYLEASGSTEDAGFMLQKGAIYPDNILQEGEYWRLFTAMFLHFGFLHLVNNMFTLVAIGSSVEQALGHVKTGILYIGAGLIGSATSTVCMVRFGDIAVAAGASGAIFGLIGAMLWICIRNRGRYGTISTRGMIIMIAISLYYGVVTVGVDNYGHIGGFVGGFLLAILLYRKKDVTVDF